jgi:hypothetical protein
MHGRPRALPKRGISKRYPSGCRVTVQTLDGTYSGRLSLPYLPGEDVELVSVRAPLGYWRFRWDQVEDVSLVA